MSDQIQNINSATEILELSDVGVLIQEKSTSTVVVNSLSDLPTPSGGTITLAANTKYIWAASVTIGTDYLTLSDGTSIQGTSGFVAQVIYTGTGGALRCTDANVSIQNLTIVPAAPGGKCWDLRNVGKNKTCYINQCIISSQDTLGVIDGFNIQFVDTCNFVNTSNGIEFKAGNYLYAVNIGFDSTNTGTFINIPSGAYIGGQIINCTMNIASGSTGINLNSATTFSAVCLIQGNLFTGAGTIITGHNTTTYYDVEYKGNSGLANTVASASLSWVSNTGTYTQTGNSYVKITGGTSVVSGISRFTHTSPNRLTYNGKKPINVKINVALAIDYQSGSAYISKIGIFKNGVLIANSENGFTVYSADEPCATNIQTTLSQGDYIEIYSYKFGTGSQTVKASFLNVQINEVS